LPEFVKVKPVVSIVLGSYNRRAFLQRTLDSVRDNEMGFPYEIIVVDGGSTDGSLDYLKRQKDVITIIQHNRGTFRGKPVERRSWGYFMNLGFKCAQGKYICMISDDCLLVPGAVTNGVDLFEKLLSQGRKVAAMAFYWRNWPDQKDYWVGYTWGGKMFVNHGLYLRDAIASVGWIEEDMYSFYHADGDLCLKLWQKGMEVVDAPDSFVEHFTHANVKVRESNLINQKKDWLACQERWEGVFGSLSQERFPDWLYRSYKDPFTTFTKFPFLSRVYASIQFEKGKIISKIKPYIKNVLE